MTALLARRLTSFLALLAVFAGIGAAALVLTPTQSAWADRNYASAAVTAGDWSAPVAYGCIAMNADGTVMAGGTCRVTSVVFDQWGDDSQHWRNYYVSVDSNAGRGYVQLTLDLAAATMRADSGVGTWKWGSNATTGGELTPTSACAAMPTLVANSPTMWGSSRTFYFASVDNRGAAPSGSVTCT